MNFIPFYFNYIMCLIINITLIFKLHMTSCPSLGSTNSVKGAIQFWVSWVANCFLDFSSC